MIEKLEGDETIIKTSGGAGLMKLREEEEFKLSLSLWRSGGARPLLSYSLRSQSLSGLFVCALFFQFTSLFPLILILSLHLVQFKVGMELFYVA